MDEMKRHLEALRAESPATDFLLVSRPIERKLHEDLTRLLDSAEKRNQSCHVFLTTYGGDPHAGYRIGRCLRHHYSKLKVIVPSYCKSAGTMIAIAANELAIGDLGELGPLDVQVTKPNEVQERGSGLDVMQSLLACIVHSEEIFQQHFVAMRQSWRMTTKQAGELAGQITAGMLSPLYAQIDPLRVGELQRALSITGAYGERLNMYAKNLAPDALAKLVSGYPSHGFVIDRKEAKELFKRVVPLTSAENALCTTLWSLVGLESNVGPLMVSQLAGGDENGDLQQGEQPARTSEATRSGSAGSGSKSTKRINAEGTATS